MTESIESRGIALEILYRIERQGGFSNRVINSVLDARPDLDGRSKALVTELVYGVLRRRATLDFALRKFLDKRTKDLHPGLLRILRLGAFQLLFMDRIPDHAAVDSTVELCKQTNKAEWAAKANAVLRRLARERDSIDWPDWNTDPVSFIAAVGSYPRWFSKLLVEQLGEAAQYFVQACNLAPSVTLRIRMPGETDRILEDLQHAGIQCRKSDFVPGAIKLERAGSPADIDAVAAGRAVVQDEASQLVVYLLGPKPGERILDACAAPGGKTLHMADASSCKADILALDLHPPKVEALSKLARNLALECIDARCADLSAPLGKDLEACFDRVLVDAPCTNTGTLRRHPEKRWTLKRRALEDLAVLQARILLNASRCVKPGGVLVYSVCSITMQEGEDVVRSFLEESRDFVLDPPVDRESFSWQPFSTGDGFLRTWPHEHDMDGFFAARMKRLE